jgi:hypothetical protein
MLPELLRLTELDREVFDEGKVVEIDGAQRLDVVGAGKLEWTWIGEDFQSVGSMR